MVKLAVTRVLHKAWLSTFILLAKAGATVVATSLKSEMDKLENLVTDITKQGGKIIALDIDLRERDQFHTKIADIVKQTQHIDVLINNAGISYYTKFFNINEQDWDTHLDINLKGAFFLAQAVAKHMVDKKISGSIINIGSIAGFQSKKYALPFCVSKAGMHHLTKIMAYELVDYGIRVNGISTVYFPRSTLLIIFPQMLERFLFNKYPLKRKESMRNWMGLFYY